MNKNLIAPCGMNCGLCLLHLRSDNHCPGCQSGRVINGRCLNCAIRSCHDRQGSYCFDCQKFPCDRLKRMDKRYQEKYGMSEIANLKIIKEQGVEAFLKQEEKKWVNSDGVFCVHDKKRYPVK